MVINSINEELLEITFNPKKESLNVLTKIKVWHIFQGFQKIWFLALVKKKFWII